MPAFVVVVYHKVSVSNTPRTVWPRITKFYTDIHTDILCCCTEYDVTNYLWSKVVAKQNVKNAASDGFGGISP